MKTKHLVIAIVVALMPTFLYAPKLVEAALATTVIVHVKSVTATTYQVHKSGTKTAFTLDADYPCTTKAGRCACPRYGLVEGNFISGGGTDLMPPIRALAGTRVAG